MSAVVRLLWIVCLVVLVQLEAATARGQAAKKVHIRLALTGNLVTWVDPVSVRAAAEPLIDVIARRVKRTYQITTVADDAELLAKMKSGKINCAFGSLREYVELAEKIKLRPVVKARAVGSETFKLLLLVRRGAGTTSIEQLRGKTVSIFEKERIYRIYLDVLLARHGVKNPGSFFSATKKKKKLQSVVLDLLLGESDACVVSDQVFNAMTRLNPRIKKKLVALDASKPYANPPLFALATVDKRLFEQVRQVAVDLNKSQQGRQLLLMFKTDQMVPAKDSDYDSFRELLKAYKSLQARKP